MDDEYYLIAKNYALRLLSIRPRSENELRGRLRSYLQKKHFGSELEDRIVFHLREIGFLDDVEFTEWWIDQRSRGSIKGISVIRLELRAKGISKVIIDSVLSKQDKNLELEKALSLLQKQAKKYPGGKITPIIRQKLKNYLYRKGFGSDVINQSIDEIYKKS